MDNQQQVIAMSVIRWREPNGKVVTVHRNKSCRGLRDAYQIINVTLERARNHLGQKRTVRGCRQCWTTRQAASAGLES